MFILSACFGMFDFGMFQHFLLSACCIPHTHTCFRPGAGFACGRKAALNCAAATLCRNNVTDVVSCMQTFILSFSRSCCCCSVLVASAQLEVAKVADNSSSKYTTTTQLQRVTQGKDAVIGLSSLASYIRQGAVIGSSIVALVVLAQRG